MTPSGIEPATLRQLHHRVPYLPCTKIQLILISTVTINLYISLYFTLNYTFQFISVYRSSTEPPARAFQSRSMNIVHSHAIKLRNSAPASCVSSRFETSTHLILSTAKLLQQSSGLELKSYGSLHQLEHRYYQAISNANSRS